MTYEEQLALLAGKKAEKTRLRVNATAARWRAKHPEKAKAMTKNWRAKNWPAHLAKQVEWRKQNPEAAAKISRRKTLRKVYGITLEQYEGMIAAQGGRCAICKSDAPAGRGNWHTDHCHETKVVRGVLCSRCNIMLGHARDNPEIMRAAIDYLEGNNDQLQENDVLRRGRRGARPVEPSYPWADSAYG